MLLFFLPSRCSSPADAFPLPVDEFSESVCATRVRRRNYKKKKMMIKTDPSVYQINEQETKCVLFSSESPYE